MAKWVPVLVRLENYEEVSRFVAQWEAERTAEVDLELEVSSPYRAASVAVDAPTSTISEEDSRLVGHLTWSEEDLRRLSTSAALTAQRWTKALDVCVEARESGEIWLPTSEIAARSGMTVNEWRDAPRKFPRHLTTNYPNVPVDTGGHHYWPLSAGGDNIPNNGGQVWWAITAETAQRWREVRGEALS